MCYEDLRQLYAATAKKRDELRRRVDLLEKEKAALLKVVSENLGCDYCKHDGLELPCADDFDFMFSCAGCEYAKTRCCGCDGARWEWCGLGGE